MVKTRSQTKADLERPFVFGANAPKKHGRIRGFAFGTKAKKRERARAPLRAARIRRVAESFEPAVEDAFRSGMSEDELLRMAIDAVERLYRLNRI